MIPAVAIPWACDGKQEAGPRNDGCPFFLQMIIREKQHLFKEITFRAILLFDFRTFFPLAIRLLKLPWWAEERKNTKVLYLNY
ncbi:MAG: hypothetical protein EOM08_11930 [Clostridia bacterium]|nr:hypothetical protein [Clostridia bacterium]